MSLRPTTLRRLGVIFGVVAILFAIGTGLYFRNERIKQAKLKAIRDAGIASFERGDYGAALENLKRYVGKAPSDTEAMYAYGTSRLRYQESDEHIGEAKNALQLVLQVDPNHVRAKRTLLELYARNRQTTEAVELADQLLKADPNDAAALRAKTFALDQAHKFNEALAVSLKLNQLDSQDLEQQIDTYQLMKKAGKPPAQTLEWAIGQQQAHPADPGFELLLYYAYRDNGNLDKCKELLQQAATRPSRDPRVVRQLVHLLDFWGYFTEAQALLDREAAKGDVRVLRLLVQRLWQRQRFEDVVQRLAQLNPSHPDSDTHLMAFKALALLELGRQPDAQPLIAAIAKRKDDPQAVAWSMALRTRGDDNPRSAADNLQSALARAPDNLIIKFMLAGAYLNLGETDLAVSHWRRVSELAPSWAEPCRQIARALSGAGRYMEAIGWADKARQLAPDQLDLKALLASLRFQLLERAPDPAGAAAVLRLAQQIQEAAPGEPISMPAYVALLAQANQRDKAAAALRSVLADPKRFDQAALLRLATISQREKLGSESQLLDLAFKLGDNPQIGFALAADLANNGKVSAGLTLLETRAGKNAAQPAQWKLAVCQYREMTRDPAAAAQWVELGNAFPNELAIQNAILKTADSVRGDRAFIGQTIERLKNITGPEVLVWKIERARWLIGSGNIEKDSADAVNTLNEVVRQFPTLAEPHLLLSKAYENLGNLPAAAKELQSVAEMQPDSPALTLDAARLLQLQSRFPEARQYIEKSVALGELSPELRYRAAAMLAQQADAPGAIKILEPVANKLTADGRLLLADLYRRTNRLPSARALYEQLVTSNPTVDVLRAAAAFYASQRDPQRAAELLAKIDPKTLRPGGRELLEAEHQEHFGTPQAAERAYFAATQAAPDETTTWAALVAYRIRQQRFEDAQIAAEEGLAHLPKAPSLQFLKSAAAALAASADGPIDLRPLAETFAANPDHPAVTSLITVVEETRTRKLSASESLAAVRKIVEQHPHFCPLQLALVQWTLKWGDRGEAIKLVARAVDQFPTSPDAPRLATAVYRSAQQWDLMAAAAARWRERTPDHATQADIALAFARLQLNDAPGALRILEPHLNAHDAPVESIEDDLISTAARAYAAADRAPDAEKLLSPLLNDPAWRVVWLNVAAAHIKSPQIATDWIDKVAPLIKPDAPDEQLTLASACYTASQRLNHKPLREKAISILADLTKRPDASAPALALGALMAEQDGNYQLAEDHYRRTLKLNPNQPGPLNNLAYLILLRGGDLAEATDLVNQALRISPTAPEYHDTLARIHVKTGNPRAGIESFQKALKLDPNNLQALIGLASLYTSEGKTTAAAPLVAQIEILLKRNPFLPPALREELDALRVTAKAASIQ